MTIRSSFHARSTALEVAEGHDLSGKTVLITGANSGIGLETACAMARSGAEVIMAVRDPSKGANAAQALRDGFNNAQIHVLPLDLSSFASIGEMATTFKRRWDKLDILINNAGVMATPFSTTPEGFELQFGTNHMGHFLLTMLLLPALLAAAPARIVALSSIAHRRSDILWDDINFQTQPYDPWTAYAQSKTANALFAVGLTQRYAEQGLTANAVHPGLIFTNLMQNVSQEQRQARGWVDAEGKPTSSGKTPEQGASTTVWAAVGSELDGVGSLYLENCREAEVWSPDKPAEGYVPFARSPESAARLWEISERMVGEHM